MDYKKAQVLSGLLFGLGVFTALALYSVEETSVWFAPLAAAAFAFIIAGGVIIFKFFRCPHCGGSLSTKAKTPTYCPHCGEKLEP